MTMRTNCILLLVILLGAFPLSVHADESGSIILYTPYTKISVTPGASIDYSIDLINNTDGVTNANLSVSGLPGSWKHEIKSGGWTLSQLSVLPQEKKTFNLKVEVPLKVNKGSYQFHSICRGNQTAAGGGRGPERNLPDRVHYRPAQYAGQFQVHLYLQCHFEKPDGRPAAVCADGQCPQRLECRVQA